MTDSTKFAYTIDEIVEQAPFGRSSVYNAMNGGELKARKRGKRTVILHDDFVCWLESLPVYKPGRSVVTDGKTAARPAVQQPVRKPSRQPEHGVGHNVCPSIEAAPLSKKRTLHDGKA